MQLSTISTQFIRQGQTIVYIVVSALLLLQCIFDGESIPQNCPFPSVDLVPHAICDSLGAPECITRAAS